MSEQSSQKPKVSVVVPSYNRADYLPATIDSILKQTYTDFEIVFVDDGSTDNTQEILEKYQAQDARVKYYKQENSERAVARTYGMSLAQGDYICLVDSDDLWYENKLEKQVELMNKNPSLVCCYASVNRIDFDNNQTKAASRQHQGLSGYIFRDLLKRNFIPSVTPMIRKSFYGDKGKASQVTEFIPYEDWDFWLRTSRLGEFHHIKEPLGDYRLHPGQSVKNVNAERIEEVTLKVLDANTDIESLREYIEIAQTSDSGTDLYNDVKEAYSLAYLRIAYWYILAEKPSIAREKLLKSFDSSRWRLLDYRWHGLLLSSYLLPLCGKFIKERLASFH